MSDHGKNDPDLHTQTLCNLSFRARHDELQYP